MRRVLAGLLSAILFIPPADIRALDGSTRPADGPSAAPTAPTSGGEGPNLLAEVSRNVVSTAVSDTRDRPECINENVNKVRIRGGGVSHAELSVEFVPCAEQAVLELVISGVANTQMVASTGPVRVCVNGLTRICGRKIVCSDGDRILTCPARVQVKQDTELTGVGTNFKGVFDGLFSRIATNAFYRGQEQTNREAAQRVERRVATEFENEANQQLIKAEHDYHEKARDPLRRQDIWPQVLQLSTTADQLRLRGRLTGMGFSGWKDPPAIVGQTDLAVRVHDSLFNIAAAKHYGGRTMTGDELDRDFTFVLGPQTAGGEGRLDQEDREQFSVTFAPIPLTAAFVERQIRATIHTRGFTSEDTRISDPYDIIIAYNLDKSATGKELSRQRLEVLPPDVASGKRNMSAREAAVAKLLSKRFVKLLPESQTIVMTDLPGPLKKLGKMTPTQADSNGGWLALGWLREPPPVKQPVQQ